MSRLFVSDLDGTLLTPEGRLSAYSRDALLRLLEGGLQFTVASARSVHAISDMLRDLPIELPIVEFNGGYLTDFASKRALLCQPLDAHVVGDVLRWARERGVPPLVSTNEDGAQRVYFPAHAQNAGIDWYHEERRAAGDPRLRVVTDLDRLTSKTVVCLTSIARESQLRPLCQQIRAAHAGRVQVLLFENRYDPGWHWLTVHAHRATKAEGVRELARRAGVPLQAVTVFGDAENDIPMFEVAGKAVAVENAEPALKDRAHAVIGPNHADSVVRYLERLL